MIRKDIDTLKLKSIDKNSITLVKKFLSDLNIILLSNSDYIDLSFEEKFPLYNEMFENWFIKNLVFSKRDLLIRKADFDNLYATNHIDSKLEETINFIKSKYFSELEFNILKIRDTFLDYNEYLPSNDLPFNDSDISEDFTKEIEIIDADDVDFLIKYLEFITTQPKKYIENNEANLIKDVDSESFINFFSSDWIYHSNHDISNIKSIIEFIEHNLINYINEKTNSN